MEQKDSRARTEWHQLVLKFITGEISPEMLESKLIIELDNGESYNPEIYEFICLLSEYDRKHRTANELKEIFKGIINDLH